MADTIDPNRAVLPVALYYNGTCGSEETNEQIATQFLEIFLDSGFSSSYCNVDDACTVQNVHVTCGPMSLARRRRTADGHDRRTKRAEHDEYVTEFVLLKY